MNVIQEKNGYKLICTSENTGYSSWYEIHDLKGNKVLDRSCGGLKEAKIDLEIISNTQVWYRAVKNPAKKHPFGKATHLQRVKLPKGKHWVSDAECEIVGLISDHPEIEVQPHSFILGCGGIRGVKKFNVAA